MLLKDPFDPIAGYDHAIHTARDLAERHPDHLVYRRAALGTGR